MEQVVLQRIVQDHEMLDVIRNRKNIDSTVEVFRDVLGVSRSTADKMIKGLSGSDQQEPLILKTNNRRIVVKSDAAYFLGISIGSSHTRVALIGLDFSPISRNVLNNYVFLRELENLDCGEFENDECDECSYSYKTPTGGADVFIRLQRLISKILSCFLAQAESEHCFPLMGFGIAVTGPVDYDEGIWRYAPRFTEIRDITLVDLVGYENMLKANDLGLFISFDNNAKAAMISEYQFMLEKNHGQFTEDIALLYIGSGVGFSAVIDGQLLRGSHNSAGELGHLQIIDVENEAKAPETIENHLIIHENYEMGLPYLLNAINCFLGVERVILIGHSVRKNSGLIAELMEKRIQFTITSTQRYCKLEPGRGVPCSSAIGAAIESYITMCHYDNEQPLKRINLANEISWRK